MCRWCRSRERLYQGHCFECYAQFTLESFGYRGVWKDYAAMLDHIDNAIEYNGAIALISN